MSDSSSDSSDGFAPTRLRRLAAGNLARSEVPRTVSRPQPVRRSAADSSDSDDSDDSGPLLTPARINVTGQGKGLGNTAGRSVGGGRLAALARSARRGSDSSSSGGEEQRFRSSVQQLAARAVQQRRQQQHHVPDSASIASHGSSDGRLLVPAAREAQKKWVSRSLSSDDEDNSNQRQVTDTRPQRDAAAPSVARPRHPEGPASPAARPPVLHAAPSTLHGDVSGAGVLASKSSSFRQTLASLRTSNAGNATGAAGVSSMRGATSAASPAHAHVPSTMPPEHSSPGRRALLHSSSMPARATHVTAGASGRVFSMALSPHASPARASKASPSGGVDAVGEQLRRSLSVTLQQLPRSSRTAHQGQSSLPGALLPHVSLPSPSPRAQQAQVQLQSSSGSTSPQRPLSPSRFGRGPAAAPPAAALPAHQHSAAHADASSVAVTGRARGEAETAASGHEHTVTGDLGQQLSPGTSHHQEPQRLSYIRVEAADRGQLGGAQPSATHASAAPAVARQDAATSPVRPVREQHADAGRAASSSAPADASEGWVAASGPGRGAVGHAAGAPPSPVRMGALSNRLLRERSAEEAAQPDMGGGAAPASPADAPAALEMPPAETSSTSPGRLDYLPPISHITQQLEELLNHVNSALGHGGAGLGSPATSPLRARLGLGLGLGLGPSPGAASQAPTEWYRPASPGLGGLARVLDTAFGRPHSPGRAGSPPPASLAALFPPPPPGADVQSVLRQLATVQRDVDALRRNVMAERASVGAAGGAASGSRPGTASAEGGAGVGAVHVGWTSPPRAGLPGAVPPAYSGAAAAAMSPEGPVLSQYRDLSSPGSYASSVSLLEQQQPQPLPAHVAAAAPQPPPMRSFGSSFLTSMTESLAGTAQLGPTAASLRTLAAPPPRPLARIEPLSVALPSRRRSVSPRGAVGAMAVLDNDPQQVDGIVEALGSIRHSLQALGDSVEGIQDIVAAGSSSAGSSPRRPGWRYGRHPRSYSHDQELHSDHYDDNGGVDLAGLLPAPRGRGSRDGSPRGSGQEPHRDGIRYEGIMDTERRSRSQSRSASPSSSPAGSQRQGRYNVDYGPSSRPGSRGRAYAHRTTLDATVAHLRAVGGMSPRARGAGPSAHVASRQRPQSPAASPSVARVLQLSPSGTTARRAQAWDKYTDTGSNAAAAAASPVTGLMVAMPAGKLRVHGSPSRSPSSPSRSRAHIVGPSLTGQAAAAGALPGSSSAPAQVGASAGGHTTTTITPRREQAGVSVSTAQPSQAVAAMARPVNANPQPASAGAPSVPAAEPRARAAATSRASGRPRLMPVEAIVAAFVDAARQAAAIEPLEALPAPNYVRMSVGGHGSPAGSVASRPSSTGGLPSSALIEDDGLVLTSVVNAAAPVQHYTAADVLHTLSAAQTAPQARGPPASVAASSISGRSSRAAAPAGRTQDEARDLQQVLQGMRTLSGVGGGGGPVAAGATAGAGSGGIVTGGRSLSPSLAAMHAETRARLREAGLPVTRLGMLGTAGGAVSTGRLSSTLGGGGPGDGGGSTAGVGAPGGLAAQRPLAPLSTNSLLPSHATPAAGTIRRYGASSGTQATPSTIPRNAAGYSQAGDRRAHVLPDAHINPALAGGGGGVDGGAALGNHHSAGWGQRSALHAGAATSVSPRHVAAVATSAGGGSARTVAFGASMHAGPGTDRTIAGIGISSESSPARGDSGAGHASSQQADTLGSASADSFRRNTTRHDSSHGGSGGSPGQFMRDGAGEGWPEPSASSDGARSKSDTARGGEACTDAGGLSFIARAPELQRRALASAGLTGSDQGSAHSSIILHSSDDDSPAWTGERALQAASEHAAYSDDRNEGGSPAEADNQCDGAVASNAPEARSSAGSDDYLTMYQAAAGSTSAHDAAFEVASDQGAGGGASAAAAVPSVKKEEDAWGTSAMGPPDEVQDSEEATSPASSSAGTNTHVGSHHVHAAHSPAHQSGVSSPLSQGSSPGSPSDHELIMPSTCEHAAKEEPSSAQPLAFQDTQNGSSTDCVPQRSPSPTPAPRCTSVGAASGLSDKDGAADSPCGHAANSALPFQPVAHGAVAQDPAEATSEAGAPASEAPPEPQQALHTPSPVPAAPPLPTQSGEQQHGMLGLLAELDYVPDPQLDLNPNLHLELGLELGLLSHEALLLGQAGDDGLLLGPLTAAAATAAAAAPSPQLDRFSRPVAAARPSAYAPVAAVGASQAARGVAVLPHNVLPVQPSLQRALEEELEAAAAPAEVLLEGELCGHAEAGSLNSQELAALTPLAQTGSMAPGRTSAPELALAEPLPVVEAEPAATPVQSEPRAKLTVLQRLQAVAEESRARHHQLLLASPALALAQGHAAAAERRVSRSNDDSVHAEPAPGAASAVMDVPAMLPSFGVEQSGAPDVLARTASVATPFGPASNRAPPFPEPRGQGVQGPADQEADHSAALVPAFRDGVEAAVPPAALKTAGSAATFSPEDEGALQQPAEATAQDAASQLSGQSGDAPQTARVENPQRAQGARPAPPPGAAADRTPTAAGTAGRVLGFPHGDTAAAVLAARNTTPRYAAVPDSPESPAVVSFMAASSGQAGGGTDESLGETEDPDNSSAGQSESSAGERERSRGDPHPVMDSAPMAGSAATGIVHDTNGVTRHWTAAPGPVGIVLVPGNVHVQAPNLHIRSGGAGLGAVPATPTAHGPVRQPAAQLDTRTRAVLTGTVARSAAAAPPIPQPLQPASPQAPLQQLDARRGLAQMPSAQVHADVPPGQPAQADAAATGSYELTEHLVAAPRLSWSLAVAPAPHSWQNEAPARTLSSRASRPDVGTRVTGSASFSLAKGDSKQEQAVLRPRQVPQPLQQPQPHGLAQHMQQSRAYVHGVVPGATFAGISSTHTRVLSHGGGSSSAHEARKQRQSTSLLLAALREINATTQSTCARLCDAFSKAT